MKIKKIILILIGCIALVLLSLWGVSEIKETNLKKLHSKMTYSSEDIYQMIDDSSTFQVIRSQDNTSRNCINKSGREYINAQVTYENKDYYICILTTSNWEKAWNLAQSWNKHAKQTNWAFNMIMFSYGDVLVQVIPVDKDFVEELDSLIIDSSNQ